MTSFRSSAPAVSVPRPAWQVEVEKIGAAFERIHGATGQLQERCPGSTLSMDLGELQNKLKKVTNKISVGPLGGLVGGGPLARCFAHRRHAAGKVERILSAVAQAAASLADDLDKMVRAEDAGRTPDAASLAGLREAQRNVSRRLDEAKGEMPKEYTRFRLRTAVIVAAALVSAVGTILTATVALPILVVPLTILAIGIAMQTTVHFSQRRDTGWKALTQLIDQFAACSRELDYDALLDVTRQLADGIRTMHVEHMASGETVLARLAALDAADRERSLMMHANERQAARNDAQLLGLRQAVDDLARAMAAIQGRLEGDAGVEAMIDQLRRQLALHSAGETAGDGTVAGMRESVPVAETETRLPPNVSAALRR
ncbi:hypothetical protein OVY01_13030 [Robbsia sp. Bb-Pol-6]|uniref:Uncharacterized protein n=1 Tax=Robbsia betulipollinis TaxID=2981849 RepID=A0ABT3ZNN2_9BURK|nr:hypothetical protein [Robbsia betulipollinis]MCY0388144.1 hypothetical protein [Robbsia betulipollinis]